LFFEKKYIHMIRNQKNVKKNVLRSFISLPVPTFTLSLYPIFFPPAIILLLLLFALSGNFYLFFIVGLGGVTLWHLQKFLQCVKYIIVEFTSSMVLLYPLVNSSNFSLHKYMQLFSLPLIFFYCCCYFWQY
jgi:hypothetical protein